MADEKPPIEIVGHKIVRTRKMSEKELDEYGWCNTGGFDSVLVLDNGVEIIAMSDEEGNGVGQLMAVPKEKNTQFYIRGDGEF